MTEPTRPKRRFTPRRIARILLGITVGAALGWSLAGQYTTPLEPNAHGMDQPLRTPLPAASSPPASAHALAPDPQANWIAGHLLAAISAIFFAGLVVGLLTGDKTKEPMEIAAQKDSH